MDFADFLKNPKQYENLGAKIAKKAILTSLPGIGEVLLAKATAGEANVPLYHNQGLRVLAVFVDVDPAQARDICSCSEKYFVHSFH